MCSIRVSVASDDHYLRVLRYVERNALRAQLSVRAEAWSWGNLHDRHAPAAALLPLSPGPMPLPLRWVAQVNRAETAAELKTLRDCLARGRPFGSSHWTEPIARRLGLLSTFRDRGRPRKLIQ